MFGRCYNSGAEAGAPLCVSLLQAFSCLLLLTKNRAVQGYRMLVFRVVFEFLQVRQV